ncbi:MAG: 7-cyano-7-deazaguanine synthase QueC [Elusimicrobia bacterium RIFOXYA2_FULL_58_8]|nr:MAG: 7-cyano-7-deazaguanine synthase QueC [Elusimicrobia bacterium RIFOXYA2_FULL_58_8]OGS13093.1 MAG: 7-cyano-7-deazaguanine synthase QueC [Elusimicrobia bacterium RIFOXYA12_FULL_57_11]
MRKKKAVVLFSGGLDSTTALCWALARGYDCRAISFDYGQRHSRENKAARKIAGLLKVRLYEVKLSFPWLAVSSLVNPGVELPDTEFSRIGSGAIPSTYVPGRNLVFASIGVSLADSIGAAAVVSGPNVVDYSGYPDCRPAFYRALEKAANAGTRIGATGGKIRFLTPLVRLSKAAIVRLGLRLKAPLSLTWSCYRGGRIPCGHCDSCKLRARGFAEAGLTDPALKAGASAGRRGPC